MPVSDQVGEIAKQFVMYSGWLQLFFFILVFFFAVRTLIMLIMTNGRKNEKSTHSLTIKLKINIPYYYVNGGLRNQN